MKKDKQPIIGRDDLNLCECPFALLTDWAEDGRKTLKFTDRQKGIIRHWIITGSDEYGLPCALDESVFIAVLFLTKMDGFKSPKIFFNQLEMLKLMGWPVKGQSYNRLSLAFSRLTGTMIETDYLWDQDKFVPGKFMFHIIDRVNLYKGKRKNTKSSYFQWGEEVFKSFQAGNLKNLDLETYFSLKTPISRRFFRLYDKRLYKTDQASFELKDLCHEKLGISRNFIYPSSLKQKLNPALKEHKAKKLLSSATYFKKKDGNWMLNIKKHKENPETLPDLPIESTETPKDDPLLKKLLLLKIPTNKAKILLQTYSAALIEDWLFAVDLVNPAPKNKAGYVIKALAEKWDLPVEAKKKKQAEISQKEEQLRAKHTKYILFQVEEHLKTLDSEQVEAEIEGFKELFMQEWGLDTLSNLWSSKLQQDFKLYKARALRLPTFEEWRVNNT